MNSLGRLLTAALVVSALHSGSATAQTTGADRTWIAGEGYDTGNCNSLSPCRSLAYAFSQTNPGGTINIYDSADYGPLTITKALTVRGDGTEPMVVSSFTINAGTGDRVVFKDMDLVGTTSAETYTDGVAVNSAGEVLVEHCMLHDFVGGTANDGAGVFIAPTTSVRVTVHNSLLQDNTIGVVVSSNGGAGHLKLFSSLLLTNLTAGVQVLSSGNDALLYGNQIMGSAKAIDLVSGGIARSYGNNVLTDGDTPIEVQPD